MKKPTNSPWGRVQHAEKIAEGIWVAHTAGHGGIRVSPELNASIPAAFRNRDGWYEEDAEWSFVALTFPEHFDAEALKSAHYCCAQFYPEAYPAFTGKKRRTG